MAKRYRYPGAPPFSYEDRKLFFGRDDDINGFYKFVNIEEVVVLYSQSGLGKSSLLNAGVVPKLREESPFEPFIVKFSSFGEEETPMPTRAIIAEITGEKKGGTFLDKIVSNDNSLWYHLKSRQIAHPEKGAFILIFDQFENLFTYPDAKVAQFGRQLADLLHIVIPQQYRENLREKMDADPGFLDEGEVKLLYQPFQVHVVFAIRSDKMSLLNRLKDSLPNILNKTFVLAPLSRAQAEDAIIYPALTRGEFLSPPFDYSDEALEHMLKFLSKEGERKIESFQLQILCQYIEENIVIGKDKKLVEKTDLGDIASIFRNYYDGIISTLPEEEQLKARIFIEEGLIFEEEMRRLNVYEGQVYKKYDISKATLQELVNKRLLRAEPSSSGGFSYELSHDTLVAPILRAKARRKREEELEAARQEEQRRREAERVEAIRKRRRRRIVGTIILTYLLLVTIGALWLYDNMQVIEEQNETLERQAEIQEELNRSLRETNENLEASESELSRSNTMLEQNAAELRAQNEKLEKTTRELRASEQELNRTVDELYEAESLANLNRQIAEQRYDDLQSKLAHEFLEKANAEAKQKSHNTSKLYALNAMKMKEYMDFNEQDELFICLELEDHPVDMVRKDYSEKIRAISVSADQQKFAVIPVAKNHLTVWEMQSGKELVTFIGHTDEVTVADFHPSGKYMASGDKEGDILVWDIVSASVVQKLERPDEFVESLRYNPDGSLLAAVTSDGLSQRLFVWETGNYELQATVTGGTTGQQNLRFSPDGKLLAVAQADNSIQLFDTKKFHPTGTVLKGHADKINCLAFNRDNKLLASGSNDNNIVIWDLESGNSLGSLEGHGTNITSLQFNPEKNMLASGDNEGVIKLWSADPETLKLKKYRSETKVSTASAQPNLSRDLIIATLKNHSKSISGLMFLENGRKLMSCGLHERVVRNWDIMNFRNIRAENTDTATIRNLISKTEQTFNLKLVGSEVTIGKLPMEELYEEADLTYDQTEKKRLYHAILDINPMEFDAVSLLASAYYNDDDYQNSITYHNRYLEKYPNDYLSWNFLGNGYYGNTNYDSALICYIKGTEIKPGYFWAWYNKGLAYMEVDKPDEAIENYRKAIEIDPYVNGLWNYLGNAYYYKEDYAQAIECYEVEINNNPDYKWAWYNLGQCYDKTGDTAGSIRSYSMALNLDPDYKEANQKLAELHFAQKNYEKAFGYYLANIEIDPDDALTWFYLGTLAYYGGGDYVYELFEQAGKLVPDYLNYAEYWNPFGLAYFKNGDYNGAAEKFRKAVTLQPDDPVYRSNLAMSLSHAGDDASATEYFKSVIEKTTGFEPNQENLDIRGFAYLNLGRNDEALDDFKESEKNNGDDYFVYRSLACYYALKGQTDLSLQNLQKSYRLGFIDYQWLENEPMLSGLRSNGSYRSLIESMRREKEQLKTSMERQYREFSLAQRGDSYLQSNDYAGAVAAYEEALQLSPEDDKVRNNLAQALDRYAESLFEQQLYDSAHVLYTRLWELSPTYLGAYEWNEVGNNFYNSGMYKLSITPYSYAVERDSTYKWAWGNLGSVYWNQLDTANAIYAYQKSVEVDPGYTFSLNGLGLIYEAKKDYEKAEDYYMGAILVDPYYTYAWNNLGHTFWVQEKKESATHAFKSVLAYQPANSYALDYLIFIYSEEQQYDSTVYFSREKVKYYTDNANDWGNLSWYAVQDRQFQLALEASEKGLALDPGQRWILVNQAHAYLMSGEVEKARRQYLRIAGELWGDLTLRDSILQDFDTLQAMGISHPQMASIRRELEQK